MQSDLEHDIALICVNGHVINRAKNENPVYNATYCQTCGGICIDSCPKCRKPIQGAVLTHHRADRLYAPQSYWVSVSSYYPRPAHCQYCGEPFPWTEKAKATVLELAEMSLTPDKYDLFKNNLDDLIRETGRQPIAQIKLSEAIEGGSKLFLEGFKTIMTDIIPKQSLDLIIHVKK
jgi:hypothetical protein